MDLQLKRLRKAAGIKSQKAMADLLGIPERRYSSWEREEVMMSLEQAYNCAVVLGCTLNDLVGMSAENLAPDELDLVECYRAATPRERQSLLFTAETFRDGGRAKNNPVPGEIAV